MKEPSPLIIGLTGGIGSGKTEVSNRFKALGIKIVDADIIARDVVTKGSVALLKISQYFDDSILLDDGNLDRNKLRNIIFLDDAKKHWLESLLHPIIHKELTLQLKIFTSSYVILSSPLLLETQQKSLVNCVLVVDCDLETQINRAMRRDGSDKKIIKAIIRKQISRKDRLFYADDIINNTGELVNLDQEVLALHKKYLSRTKRDATWTI